MSCKKMIVRDQDFGLKMLPLFPVTLPFVTFDVYEKKNEGVNLRLYQKL